VVSAEVTTTPARKGPDLRKPSQLPRWLGGPNSMTEEASMAETTASTSSLMHTNSDDIGNELTTVEVADSHGYSEYKLNKHDTLDLLERITVNRNVWIFAGGQQMQPTQLADADWQKIGTVRITPPLVGGPLPGSICIRCKEEST